ncbi:Flagellar hook-associated protein FlgL [hydrothermal vent metagenome]|uniref:Flagellar hook-associated protein FlgL n=1 Tax=hydrothermal vent metagenome TaxID=652676 RepID=A0A3B1E114_9ZZZZ
MRITQSNFYDQYKSRQVDSVSHLNNTYEQITTAKKISDGYQDPLKMINTLNLDTQEAFFEQIDKIANQSVDFSRNTDTVLGDFQKTLTRFKQKLTSAANGTHSATSLNSISQELEVLIRHLRDAANTSINKNYLFAGSNVATRPISDKFEYRGNKDSLGVLLGKSDSLASYNISGYELLYGRDEDFNKVVSSNVKHLNTRLLRPDIMTTDLKISKPTEVYITSKDTIRDMMGDNDDSILNNKKSIFYFRGQNIYGDIIKEKITMDGNDKISTLLKKIEDLYDGFVEANVTEDGQIKLSSKIKGNENLDFHMFGAIDRSTTKNVNQADVGNIDDLLKKEDVDIVEFMYSALPTAKIASSIISSRDVFDNKKISMRSSFLKSDQSPIALSDKLEDILHNKLTKLTFKGTDVNGNTFNKNLNVDADTDIKDLFLNIQYALSGSNTDKKVSVSIVNDKLIIQENTNESSKNKPTLAKLEIVANDGKLNAFSGIEAMNVDRVSLNKDKNTLQAQLSQVDRFGEFATRDTKLQDVAQGSLKNAVLEMDIKNINGVEKKVNITLDEQQVNFEIDGVKYNVVNDNLLSVAPGFSQNKINVPDYYDLDGIEVGDTISINGSVSKITTVDNQYKFIEVNPPFTSRINVGDSVEFETPQFKRTNYNNMTYGQLMDIVGMTLNDNLPKKINDPGAYKNAIFDYGNRLDISLDIRGKLKIVDKVESLSKIDLSIYDKNSNDFNNNNTPSILLNANNAVVLDTPSVDFFQDLQDAVYAVRNNIVSTDAFSNDSRSTGIRGGIKAVDHLSAHIAKMRTIAGTNSQTINNTIDRIGNIITTTKELKNQTISTDIAETMAKFNEQALNYSALLKIVNRINELTLTNYYR